MSRRNRDESAAAAAAAASEAGRVLQAQRKQPEIEPEAHAMEPQQSVDTEDRPRPAPRDEARMKALEEIWNRDAESKGIKEPAEKVPEPSIVKEPVPPTPEQMLQGGKFSEATPEPEAEATPEAATEPETPKIETVRVKVDGEEFDVPKADVEEAGGVKAFQIAKAAENRLEKANKALAEAKQMQDAVARFAQQNTKPAEREIPTDQFIASKMDVIRYGTPEEGAAAMAEIQSRLSPKIDQNTIINQAVTQMNYMNGVKQFSTEFADIAVNPMLMRLVKDVAQERITEIPDNARASVDWSDFYRRIGNEVRSVVGKPNQHATTTAAQMTGPTSQVSSDKEARKASIVNLPTAAARAELPKESKPDTREDTLSMMRKARGLPNG